jgi:uncharacterized protein (DUF1697 family)
MRYVARLRAVNVGGRNRMPMRELRAALEPRFDDVSTVLQSGNVLVTSDLPERTIAAEVGLAIQQSFGLHISVVARSAAEIARVVRSNPFLARAAGRDPASLHVAFLPQRPDPEAILTIDHERSPLDACVVSGREIYLDYLNGSGKTRLTLGFLERRLGVVGTARNWRTVQQLADLIDPGGGARP